MSTVELFNLASGPVSGTAPFNPLGLVTTVIGQVARAQVAEAAARRSAGTSEAHAALAQQQAASDEERARARVRAAAGRRQAVLGKSGIASEGTPLDVSSDDAASAELDALSIRQGGLIRAQRALDQAESDRYDGRLATRLMPYGAGARLLDGLAGGSSARRTTPARDDRLYL